MVQPARILLVDDHPLFREALAATVQKVSSAVTVEQCESLAQARGILSRDEPVSLVLLDLGLPDSNGISGLLLLKANHSQVPVAIISANDSAEMVETAAVCGAAGFVSKSATVDELTAAVETLMRGEAWFAEGHAGLDRPELTETQARILDGVHRGLMNKQIAYELGLSEATIKYHLTTIFRLMRVQTRAQLLALSQPG